MDESSKKRVVFAVGEQKKFIDRIQKLSGFSSEKLAEISHISTRNFREWRRENTTMSFFALEQLTKITKIAIPKDIKIIDAYSHNSEAAKKGGQAVFKKYGALPFSEKQRMTGWKKWWEATGKNNPSAILLRKEIRLPQKSIDLAEFCGILIGDGGITKYQVTITLNGVTDRAYSQFVVTLIQKLFQFNAKVYKVKSSKAINVSISSRNVVIFLVGLGIKLGHKLKQNFSIPQWIMDSKEYRIACLRGMIDTDGCVVHETHIIKEKKYTYPRLNFTSASPLLIKQAIETLLGLGFNPEIRSKERSVQLENLQEICKYFYIVGSSNPKHLERISRWY